MTEENVNARTISAKHITRAVAVYDSFTRKMSNAKFDDGSEEALAEKAVSQALCASMLSGMVIMESMLEGANFDDDGSCRSMAHSMVYAHMFAILDMLAKRTVKDNIADYVKEVADDASYMANICMLLYELDDDVLIEMAKAVIKDDKGGSKPSNSNGQMIDALLKFKNKEKGN